MKRYYFFLSRVSLGIIIIQAFAFLLIGFNTGSLDRRLDLEIRKVQGNPPSNDFLRQAYGTYVDKLVQIQNLNKSNKLLEKLILGVGLVYIAIFYSLYLYFLRMGYSWTKWFLHLNNLTIAIILPATISVIWLVGYIIGTRLLKHFFIVKDFDTNEYQN